jgi:hypothetical protein
LKKKRANWGANKSWRSGTKASTTLPAIGCDTTELEANACAHAKFERRERAWKELSREEIEFKSVLNQF